MCWVISAYIYENDFFLSFSSSSPDRYSLFPSSIHWYTDGERGDVSSLTGPSSAHDSPQAHGTYIDPPILFSSSNSNVSSSHFHRLHYNALIIQTSCMKKHPWITKTLKPHIAIPQARQVSIPILFMSVFFIQYIFESFASSLFIHWFFHTYT